MSEIRFDSESVALLRPLDALIGGPGDVDLMDWIAQQLRNEEDYYYICLCRSNLENLWTWVCNKIWMRHVIRRPSCIVLLCFIVVTFSFLFKRRG